MEGDPTPETESEQNYSKTMKSSPSKTPPKYYSNSSPIFKPKIFSKPKKSESSNPGSSGCSSQKKNKLRTSKDVYNRLKWDSTSLGIDLSLVHIGYKDRFLGMCETPFSEFNPTSEGDIPYHRIYYFRGGGPPVCPLVGKSGEVQVRENNWPKRSILYWDRDTRLDLIFNSGQFYGKPAFGIRGQGQGQLGRSDSEEYELPIPTTAPRGYSIQPSYKFDPKTENWEEITVNTHLENQASASDLKLISYNVLFELYDPEIVQCGIRWPYLIDFLEDSQADLIALQEVTPPFLSILESQDWVRQEYFLSEISSKGTTISPLYGQILLSKFPPQAVYFTDQLGKRFTIVSYLLGDPHGFGRDEILLVSNVHLKSNLREDNSKVRQMQIQNLFESISEIEKITTNENVNMNVMIVGDTNFGNCEFIEDINFDFLDVWLQLEDKMKTAKDFGFTYNCDENEIARKQSKDLQNKRLDRIFLKKSNHGLVPINIKVIGRTPIDFTRAFRTKIITNEEILHKDLNKDQLWLSDHYGLECHFRFQFAAKPEVESKLQPVYTSAVVIIPPEEFWTQIQTIRSEFDPSFNRWPPHINLLYGFIPDSGSNFTDAAEVFTDALAEFEPFECSLSEIGIFQHLTSSTVYLTSGEIEVAKIQHLQHKLYQKYPICDGQSSKSSHGFTPHLTIAKLPSRTPEENNRIENLVANWKQIFGGDSGINFKIDRVHLISRKGSDSPFRIGNSVLLNQEPNCATISGQILDDFLKMNKLLPTTERNAVHVEVLLELEKYCKLAITNSANSISIHMTGSTFMGFHDDSSDLDVLCYSYGPTEISHVEFFRALESLLISDSDTNRTETGSKLELVSIVLESIVPVARLRYKMADIDLVFARSNFSPDPLKISDFEMALMTQSSLKSIGGVFDAQKLLIEIVPQSCHKAYQTAVRSLKIWARRRNIYSKAFGFIASHQISLLVAYTIQNWSTTGIHTKIQTPEKIVIAFFKIFASWKWPKPVEFEVCEKRTRHSSISTQRSKVSDLMPILSPSFPYLNTVRNVTRSTRYLLQMEFKRAQEIFQKNLGDFEIAWDDLIVKSDFFRNYDQYLAVRVRICCGIGNSLDSDLNIVRGILTSRFVYFIVNLEKNHDMLVHPYPEIDVKIGDGHCDDKMHSIKNSDTNHSYVLSAFVGMDIKNPQNLTNTCEDFENKFIYWTADSNCKCNVRIQIECSARNN